MRRTRQYKRIAMFLAFAVLLAAIYFLAFFDSNDTIAPNPYFVTSVSISPGSNETQMNFSWLASNKYASSVIEFIEVGGQGNAEPKQIEAESRKAIGEFTENEVTISGLEASSEYFYRLGDGKGNWAKTRSFKTQDSNSFNFLLMGDPQIGSSDNLEVDRENWKDTLDKALSMFPKSSFIQSAGDQVEEADSRELYEGFFYPDVLQGIPFASTIGNHDHGKLYENYFNMPNQSIELGETEESPGNYFFTYGNALIINLNTNSNNVNDHTRFIEETLAATKNLELKWRIIVGHHSIYSVGEHTYSPHVLALREGLVPAIDELDIDAVLMGHDHSYARSYQMKNFSTLKNQKIQDGAVINPDGTLYLTANSASGSKFYPLSQEEQPYAAVKEQLGVPTFTNVEVSADSLEFLTFRTDTMELTDSYKIVKDESIEVELPGLDYVEIAVTGSMLPTEPSEFYPEMSILVTGVNTEGGPFDLLPENTIFKTSSDDQVSISPEGKVTVLENASPGKLDIWAEIKVNDKNVVTDKVQIELVEHEEKELIPGGSVWSFLDDGSDQGLEWRGLEFDESGWKTGKAPLGYPHDESRPTFKEVETEVNIGEDEANKYATTYFRHEFSIDDVSSIRSLGYIEFEVDDSVILYLNGTEIGRFNLPEVEISYDDFVRDVAKFGIMDENRTEKLFLTEEQMQHLKVGKNVLAAEVHQDRQDSSDLYWALRFTTN